MVVVLPGHHSSGVLESDWCEVLSSVYSIQHRHSSLEITINQLAVTILACPPALLSRQGLGLVKKDQQMVALRTACGLCNRSTPLKRGTGSAGPVLDPMKLSHHICVCMYDCKTSRRGSSAKSFTFSECSLRGHSWAMMIIFLGVIVTLSLRSSCAFCPTS